MPRDTVPQNGLEFLANHIEKQRNRISGSGLQLFLKCWNICSENFFDSSLTVGKSEGRIGLTVIVR